jgi:hypothetical protein
MAEGMKVEHWVRGLGVSLKIIGVLTFYFMSSGMHSCERVVS